MTDAPRTAEEMREAAAKEAAMIAQIYRDAAAASVNPTQLAVDRDRARGAQDAADAIRAIPIAPPPDREALAELAEGSIVGQPSPIDAARAVIAALETAGALK